MKIRKNILLLFLLYFITVNTNSYSQNTYYVNGNDNMASDYNSGTSPDSAWKTLKRACLYTQVGSDTVIPRAGDTVIVMPGKYHETISPNNSGDTINGYITFRSEIPLSAHLNGYIPLDSAAEVGSSWETDTVWEQYNPALTNVWKHKLKNSSYCEAYRNNIRMPSILDELFDPNSFQSGMCYTVDSTETLYIFLEDSLDPFMFEWGITLNVGVWLFNQSYIKVRDFYVDSFGLEGIDVLNSHHIEISGNKSAYNGRTGIAVNFNNSSIYIKNNDACYNGCNGLGWSSGISVYKPQSENIWIENNISHHNCDSSSIHSDGNGFILDNSTSEGRDGGCVFKNNLSYLNQGSGIRLYRSANCYVVNNTCYRNNADELCISDYCDTIGTHDVTVENNIFFAKPVRPALYIYLTRYEYGDIISDYNLFLRGDTSIPASIFIDTLGTSYSGYGFVTLSSFQNFSTLDSNSICADPLLDSLLHLTAFSPCIDIGDPDLDNDDTTYLSDTNDQDPDGTRLDLGAFYYHQYTAVIEITISENISVNIYPNPFSNSTTLQITDERTTSPFDGQTGYDLKIFNMSGNIVFEKTLNSNEETLNFSLPDGIYFLRVSGDNFIQTKKLEVIK